MDIQLNKSKFGKNNGANAIAKRALLVAMLLGGGAVLLGQLNADEINKSNRVDLGESSVDSRKDSSESAGKLQDSSANSSDLIHSAHNSDAVYIGESVITA